MAVTAAMFLSYSSFQNLLRHLPSNRTDPNASLSFTQLGIAAADAGAVASFVLYVISFSPSHLHSF
jgi:ornithine carrier protein